MLESVKKLHPKITVSCCSVMMNKNVANKHQQMHETHNIYFGLKKWQTTLRQEKTGNASVSNFVKNPLLLQTIAAETAI